MKPLICPQCGGKIINYSAWQQFAICDYCETRFVIEQAKPAAQAAPVYEPLPTSGVSPQVISGIIVGGLLLVGGLFFTVILFGKKAEKPTYPAYNPPRYSTPAPTASPTATPNPNLLEFGGKGTGDGLFQDAGEIAVDKRGRIYVADQTMRVQQFDANGKFLKVWQVPAETQYYKRARSIEKIAVDAEDRLYVLIDYGVVLVYENDSSKPLKLIHFAPNPIQDFAFRADGDRMFLVNDGKGEYLVQETESAKMVRRINRFHSNAADSTMSPAETGLAAIRFAVDGAGNIYSIYALGDLGSYELSYNEEDFRIYRFTPEGKYVNKFAETMNSCGIALDNQSRVYVSNRTTIDVYNNNGDKVAAVYDLIGVDSFALDAANNVYILNDDRVIKRPAVHVSE